MPFNPGQPVQIKVEINVTALGWVDVTSRGRAASCVIKQGMSANGIQAETSRLDLRLGNPDGYLTEDNASSPWVASWGRGCEIRVSRLGLTISPIERFHGQVESIVERYPGGNVDAFVEVTAVGTLGILERGSDPLRSPLTRAMAGISAGDFQPVAHWPMEDGSTATRFGSLVPGIAAAVIGGAAGTVAPAGYSGASGSDAVPVLNADGKIAGVFPPMTITGNGSGDKIWQFQFMGMVKSGMGANSVLLDTYIPDVGGDHVVQLRVQWINSTSQLVLRLFDRTGTQVGSDAVLDFATYGSYLYNTPALYGISVYTVGASPVLANVQFAVFLPGQITSPLTLGGTNWSATSLPVPLSWRAYGDTANAGWSFSHAALYTDPAIFTSPNQQDNADAINGYSGETAADRMARLCLQEGVSFTLTGTAADTAAMGPQLIDTLPANLRNAAITDQGLLSDNGTSGAIAYRTRTSLYNQTASVAVVNGSIEPDLAATRDFQYTRNDITSTARSGSFAHAADETHVAKVRARLKDSRSPNTANDDQLVDDAAWAVHLGVAPGARYNSVGVNLRNSDGALLADAVAGHDLGDRLTVATTALPPQHKAAIDGLTIGWVELLDIDTWIFRANVVPYSPYTVAKWDDAGSLWDTAVWAL